MSAAAAQFLDTLVPIIRTRLPRGMEADYLDAFLDGNRFALVNPPSPSGTGERRP